MEKANKAVEEEGGFFISKQKIEIEKIMEYTNRSFGTFKVLFLSGSSLVYFEAEFVRQNAREFAIEKDNVSLIWKCIKYSATQYEFHLLMSFFMSIGIYYNKEATSVLALDSYNTDETSMTQFYIYLHSIIRKSNPNEDDCFQYLNLK